MKTPATLLRIIIVGAGPIGLSAAWALASRGHNVTLVERKESLPVRGGDIQVSPNGTRALHDLKLNAILATVASPHPKFVARDAETFDMIYSIPLDIVGKTPSMMFKRKDLVETLLDAATKAGVKCLWGKSVVAVREEIPAVELEDGQTIDADLVIGADGIASSVRSCIFPNKDSGPLSLDEVCFQTYVPYEEMATNADTLELWAEGLENLGVICGNTNYLTYWSNKASSEFFMIASQQNYQKPVEVGKWVTPGDVNEMRELLKGYGGPIKSALKSVTSCERWRVGDSVDGLNWVSKSAKCVLLGDAIHAMPPNAAQGITQGFEDVAALVIFIDSLSSSIELPDRMRDFARIRTHRVQRVIGAARNNIGVFGMPPGEARDARDAIWKTFNLNKQVAQAYNETAANPDADYNDLNFVKWITTYNATQTARQTL